MSEAFITVAGVNFPWPAYASGLQTQTTSVSGGRNAKGVFIGQRVGRDEAQVELFWPVMPAAQWSALLQLFKTSYVNDVTYFDAAEGQKVTRKMYVSDRSQAPHEVDSDGNVTVWRDCKLNLIDTGG